MTKTFSELVDTMPLSEVDKNLLKDKHLKTLIQAQSITEEALSLLSNFKGKKL